MDGKTCTSRTEAECNKEINDAVNQRLVNTLKADRAARSAVVRLAQVLSGQTDHFTTTAAMAASLLKTTSQKIAFLRQTGTLFSFPEASTGGVNHLRVVHAKSKDCVLNASDCFMEQWERVVRIASKNRKKIFRWSGKLLENTVGIGCFLQDNRLVDMKLQKFHEWCRIDEIWFKNEDDPMLDCNPEKEWRRKDLFVMPLDPDQPLIIKAMGSSVLVVGEYTWLLDAPLSYAVKHNNHMDAVLHANKILFSNGILVGHKLKPSEQSYVTLLRNYLGAKNTKKSLSSLPKSRRIEF